MQNVKFLAKVFIVFELKVINTKSYYEKLFFFILTE